MRLIQDPETYHGFGQPKPKTIQAAVTDACEPERYSYENTAQRADLRAEEMLIRFALMLGELHKSGALSDEAVLTIIGRPYIKVEEES